MTLVGISGDRDTQGSSFLHLRFGRKTVAAEFQIVRGSPPERNGILGQDVIRNSTLDLHNRKLYYFDPKSSEERIVKKLVQKNEDFKPSTTNYNVHEPCENVHLPASFDDFFPKGVKVQLESFQNPEPCETNTEVEKVDEFVRKLNNPSTKIYMISSKKSERNVTQETKEKPRVDQILSTIGIEHLTTQQKQEIKSLVSEFPEVFKLEQDELPATTAIELNIPLNTEAPIYTPQYKLPKAYRDAAYKQAMEWERQGICRPSTSPMNSPLLVVPKKGFNADGTPKLRVCADLRKINQHLVKSFYQLPSIHTMVNEIPRAKYYTTIDLAQGYLQIPVAESDRYKLAFTAGHKRYEFCRSPFGLSSSGYCFSKMMSTKLSKLIETGRVFIYLDDILIAQDTAEEMMKTVREICETFRTFTLRINPEKMELLKDSVSFLGFTISSEGILPSSDKTSAINNVKPPKNTHDVLSFLAMTNFFKQFIPDHSRLCEPLYHLVRKDVKFEWDNECQENFEELKRILVNPPLLTHASVLDEPNVITILFTDASNVGVGACLAALVDKKIKPVAYSSRTLNKQERNYSTYEREFLGVVWSITDQFKYLLLGREQFYVLTDHKALLAITNTTLDHLEGRPLRWRLKLENYNFKIMYVKGEYNGAADYLSRQFPDTEFNKSEEVEQVGDSKVYAVQTRSKKQQEAATTHPDDSLLQTALQTAFDVNQHSEEQERDDDNIDSVDELKFPSAKEIKDKAEQLELIELYHRHPIVGHLGAKKSLMRLRERFFFKGMNKLMKEFVRKCEVCQRVKSRNNARDVPLGAIAIPTVPWSHIHYDLIGPFEPSPEGFKYVLTAQDVTTRFCVCRPIESRDADVIARVLFEEVFLNYGCCHTITSDNAKELTSAVVANLMKLLQVKKTHTTIYNPQANISERLNSSIKTYIKCFLMHEKIKSSWPNFVKLAAYAFNVCPHSRTGYAPYTLLFGRLANDAITRLNLPPIYTFDTYYDEIRQRIRTFNQIAKEKTELTKLKDKAEHDRTAQEKRFEPGEKVLVRRFVRGPLDERMDLAVVIRDINSQNVMLRRNNKQQTLSKNHVFKYYAPTADAGNPTNELIDD